MSDISARLKAARLPERTVEICLRGDLVAEFEQLDRQWRAAIDRPATSLADGGEGVEIAAQMEAVRADMQGEMLTLRLRALPRRRWSELVAEHPVRRSDDGTTHADDEQFGYNSSTFFEALVRESVIDPVLSHSDWATLDDVLTDSNFMALANAAVMLNRRSVDIPFSLAVSQTLTSSEPE